MVQIVHETLQDVATVKFGQAFSSETDAPTHFGLSAEDHDASFVSDAAGTKCQSRLKDKWVGNFWDFFYPC